MNASRSPQAASSVEDVLITQELFTRKPRLPDLAGENQALVKLAHEAAQNPRSLIQKLVEITAALCHAESAGISLLENSPNGKIFRWRAVSGRSLSIRGHPPHATPVRVESVLIVDRLSSSIARNDSSAILRASNPRSLRYWLCPSAADGIFWARSGRRLMTRVANLILTICA